MLIIGLTGGSGGGKSTVGSIFCELGAHSIDADAVYHDLLENSDAMKRELASRFPESLDDDGTINRRKLASVVFSDESALSDLNAISHKFVIAETERIMSELYLSNADCVCIDAIALFESGLGDICDVTIGVVAPRELRISRITERDNISREAAEARINAQKPDSYFIEKCDYTITNSDDLSAVRKSVCDIFDTIMKGTDKCDE